MTYPHGPREGAPKTVRLEDQPLPDREASFHTPRAGDWLLLAVLVVALLGIGARVWSQLGFGDPVGRAIFLGLMLLAIYWTALVYTFKLSLSARVGPQGLAIVRGPWRVELRWSEITRLMERPQAVGGRRYRWVVALARDGRRIQVREDALLDYERFRREVYQRYRMWRDHGGTWGATGGGPFVARESVGDEARWWAFAALMIALPGLYLALLPPFSSPAGYALLALALVCLGMVAAIFLGRRAYALDGRGIEARGAVERIHLAWRDVSKVERTRHPAGGVILAVVAMGRLALRLAARGDAGIRGFAWSPRVPEYLTLRGGGRHARIRLHHLTQPEELLAWIEFYTGLRRAGPSRPLEPAAASAARNGAPEAAMAAAMAADSGDEREPDLSGVAGPRDPWAGARRGAPMDEPGRRESAPLQQPVPEALFQNAALGSSFHEPDGLDQPPPSSSADEENDEAWLRETSALFSMSGGAPPRPGEDAPEISAEPPSGAIEDAQTVATPATPATPAAPHPRQFAPPPFVPRAAPPPRTPPSAPPRATPLATPFAPHSTPPPRPQSPFAPYIPDVPDAPDGEPGAAEAEPSVASAARWDIPPAHYEGGPASQPERANLGASEAEGGEDADGGVDEPAPWRDSSWQPPILPRFGPPGEQPGGERPPRRDGRQTDR